MCYLDTEFSTGYIDAAIIKQLCDVFVDDDDDDDDDDNSKTHSNLSVTVQDTDENKGFFFP